MSSSYGLPRSIPYGDIDLVGSMFRWSEKQQRVVKSWGTRPGLLTMPHDAFCHLGECLLVAPKVTLPVRDSQNGTLRGLLNVFGLAGVHSLLESGAIEFLCVPKYFDVPSYFDDYSDLQSQNADPPRKQEVDVEECFFWGAKGAKDVTDDDARIVVELALKKTNVVSESEVTETAIDRYARWAVPDGPSPLSTQEVRTTLRDELLAKGDLYDKRQHEIGAREAFFAFQRDCDVDLYEEIHPSKSVNQLANERAKMISEGYGIPATFGEVLKQEQIPSVRDLIDKNFVDLARIPDLRARHETVEFRRWLWGQPDPFTAADVTAAYRRVIVSKPVDFESHTLSRVARITSVSLAGSVMGAGASGLLSQVRSALLLVPGRG